MLGLLQGAFQKFATTCDFVSLLCCTPMTTGRGNVKSGTSSGPILVSKMQTSLGKLVKLIKVYRQYFDLCENILDKNNFIDGQARKNNIQLSVSSGFPFTIRLITSASTSHIPPPKKCRTTRQTLAAPLGNCNFQYILLLTLCSLFSP